MTLEQVDLLGSILAACALLGLFSQCLPVFWRGIHVERRPHERALNCAMFVMGITGIFSMRPSGKIGHALSLAETAYILFYVAYLLPPVCDALVRERAARRSEKS